MLPAEATTVRLLIQLQNPIAAFQPTPPQLQSLRERLPHCDIVQALPGEGFLEALGTAEAAVVWTFRGAWYPLAPRLRRVFTPSAGREGIEPDPTGRVTLSFGSFHGKIMAESLLAMLLCLERRLPAALHAQQQRRWERELYADTRPLAGQVALLVGVGAIGRHCAHLLKALGMRVQGVRRQDRPVPGVERVFTVDRLGEALGGADHVVCILPGDTGTTGILDERALAAMKPGACLYNLGRGNAIDSAALQSALRSGHLGGAFLDVTAEEPLPSDSALWSTPGLYLAPHASAIRRDYLDLYFDELVASIEASLEARAAEARTSAAPGQR